VARSQADRDFTVAGTITVTNPSPALPMTLEVTDTLGQGLPAVAVDCDPNTDGAQSTIVLAGGESRVCTYSVDLGDTRPADGVNTATATLVGGGELRELAATPVTASAPYAFSGTPSTTTGPASVTVTDTFNNGNAETLGVADGTLTFPAYTRDITCPSGITAGTSTVLTVPNVARIVETGQTASRTVTVTCTAPAQTPVLTPVAPSGTPVTPVIPAGTPVTPLRPASRARLVVDKRAPRQSTAGQVVSYTITVRNTGRVAARNVVLTDTVPAQMSLLRRVAGARMVNGTLTWRLGTIAARGSKTVRLQLRLSASSQGQRCNVASATAANASRTSDRACTRVAPVANRVIPAVTG
jgi:uncharacterized repeat protein (TIGR01451 family)